MIIRTIVACALAVGAAGACNKSSDPAKAADNTDRNKIDRAAKPVADESGKSSGDVDVAKKIRSSVVGDDTLSTTAHNAKIVVQDGKVTLTGPVKSAAESTRIEKLAADVVGETNVVNQLEVKE